MTQGEDALDGGAEWNFADNTPIAEEALDELQQLHALRLALDRLDDKSRSLMLMLFRDEEDALSYEDVARQLGVPVGSIGPTRARCLAKLRRLL
jgi:DNA-directed RNA polymerase specialized sigma24 family protein